jgi:hypothetical protein
MNNNNNNNNNTNNRATNTGKHTDSEVELRNIEGGALRHPPPSSGGQQARQQTAAARGPAGSASSLRQRPASGSNGQSGTAPAHANQEPGPSTSKDVT